MRSLAIVHFQPLENYPPVMNLINSLSLKVNFITKVYTTGNNFRNWFAADKITINRVATTSNYALVRYWCYIKFNITTFFYLIIKQPNFVVAFETYSIFPVYLYKKLFIHSKIFIHYHEYISINEIKTASTYFKFLNFFEKKLFLNCDYISQTNSDRLKLFLIDNPFVNNNKTFVAPNFPSKNWLKWCKLNRQVNNSGIVKLIHVGALSIETMYVQEMIEWVIKQNGKYTIDFYTNNITIDAKLVFDNLKTEYVKILGSINYFELPKILIKYDVGVTLYNGHIPNYIYSVPNKVFEYLYCGLDVWYSKDLISTHNLNANNQQINDQENIPEFLSKLVLKNDFIDYYDDNILINKILQYV